MPAAQRIIDHLRGGRTVLVLAPVAVVAGMGVATHSVVRYKLWIVLTYTLLTALLAWWQLAPKRSTSTRTDATSAVAGLAAGLVLAAGLHVKVSAYSYTSMPERQQIRWLFAITALLVAAVLVASLARRTRLPLPDVALGLALIGYLTAAVLLIRWDPAPKIDVWVSLQQSADGIARGANVYTLNWHNSPGVQDAFTYLPFTALLLAPGRWLAGDVRWALVVITVLGVLAVRALAAFPGRRPAASDVGGTSAAPMAAAGAAALVLLLPGTSTQVEQAWTEPLLFACLAGWALGVQRIDQHRAYGVLAVVAFALGLASKQHLVLLLPLLAVWPRFGWRRSLASAALAAAFVLPWFIASPGDMWHDTVTVLVNFQPLIFADTLYIAAINNLSWTPPFWLTGLAVLGTWVLAVLMVRRRQPALSGVLRWAALVLFVANLVNKQAFYNQYWLVAALVVISLAVPSEPDPSSEPGAVTPVHRQATAGA